MYKSRFLIGFLVFLVLAISLAVGSYALYQFGYSQGYTTGVTLSAVEESPAFIPGTALAPVGLYGYPGLWGFTRPLLLCFAAGAFLIVLFTISKTIRFLTWRSIMSSDPEKWHNHWRRYHRHGPPGWYGDDQPKAEETGSNA
jgi:hypothetical protein